MRKRIVAGVLALLVTFSSISFPQKVQAETATEENAATETGDSEGTEETGTENAGETESTGEPDYGATESTGEPDTEGTETVIEETGTETEAEEPITTAEMNAMLSDAATIYASTVINENYDSSYVFADYVVEVPYGTEVSIDENDIVTITGLTRNISVGDTFVVYPTELPCLYMAASVETNGENTVITTSEADEASAIVSIDAEGTAAIDLSQFEEAEGVTAQYVTSEAQAQMLSAARGISVTKDSVLASKEITLSNGVKATITCNLTDLALNHNIDSANNSYYVSVSGTSTISGTVSIDAVAASGASSSITLGSVRVAGIGKVTISADLTLAGKIVATYTGGFEAGVQYSSSNGFRLVKSFTKKSFTTAAEAEASIGLKADFGVNMLLAKASIYATTGIQAKFISNSYNDGNTPNNCTNISAWLYARVGASATFGVGSLSKSFSKDLDIFTAENSPIYISYHYEDGKQVYSCARGSKNSQGGNYFYYTGANSYYGYSSYGGGSSKGVDSNGNEYVIYTYEVDGRNATITGYKGNASVMVIPERLDGYTVTAIGNSAFWNNTRLAAVVIPDTVTSLGNSIFYGCEGLSDVSLGKGITGIPGSTFYGYAALPKIVIPYNVTTIGDSAFVNCTNLTSVTIPRNTTSIASNAFSYPKKMTIYGIAGTYAEQFAKEKGITFVNKEVKATAVSLNKTKLTLDKGSSETLTFTVTPADFTDVVSWKSSNTNVVTVTDAGVVKAVGGGTATIKAVAADGSGKWDSCEVTVINEVHYVSDLNDFQSGHNYDNNCSDYWVYTMQGATELNVTFDAKTALEANYDYLYISDGNGKQIGSYTGTELAGKTIRVSGNTVRIQLVTDSSGTAWGFRVSKVEKAVQPKNISSCTATLRSTSYTYNGKERKPGVTVKDGSKTLTKDTDYTVSYAKNINKGTAEVTIKGKGNYTGSKKLTFTINAKKIADVKVSGIADQYYTGKAIKPGVTVKDGSVKDTDYTLAYSDNKETGTATVTMKGKGNYTGSKKVTFKIVKKVSSVKASSAGYNSVKVSWSSIKGVSGYKIYRSTSKNGKYSLVKTIKEWDTTSYKDTKLTTGKTYYYYKVRAYRTVNGKKIYGSYSSVKSVKISK